MGKYIEDSIKEIKAKHKEGEKVVLRIETASGSETPRLILVTEVYDDYIVGRGRKQPLPELFAFAHITNWRFVQYKPEEWKG